MMATPDDLVHCPICLELYIQPRALPCLHTFCDTCLQEYINAASRNATLAYGFECPICRRHTAPPSPAKNGHSGWSKQFPLNHIVVTLLDARENSSKSANPGDEISASTSTNNSGSSINESTPSCPDTHNGQGTSNQTSTSSSQYFPQESTFHAQKGYDSTSDDYSYEDEDHEYWPIPPPHHLHPHGPPPPPGPHCRPPPPGPHDPPPPFGPPHHPHWPPPHHLRPHHRGRGCHRPNGGPMEGFHPRGPRGRFPHPHGPRHRHHHPPF